MLYAFVYRCRRCGGEENGTRTGDKDLALKVLIGVINDLPYPNAGVPVAMLTVHGCQDDGYGVAELQGVSPLEEE